MPCVGVGGKWEGLGKQGGWRPDVRGGGRRVPFDVGGWESLGGGRGGGGL